jgi:hypothetical protein
MWTDLGRVRLGKGCNRGELGAVMSADGDTIGRVSWRIDLLRLQVQHGKACKQAPTSKVMAI